MYSGTSINYSGTFQFYAIVCLLDTVLIKARQESTELNSKLDLLQAIDSQNGITRPSSCQFPFCWDNPESDGTQSIQWITWSSEMITFLRCQWDAKRTGKSVKGRRISWGVIEFSTISRESRQRTGSRTLGFETLAPLGKISSADNKSGKKTFVYLNQL